MQPVRWNIDVELLVFDFRSLFFFLALLDLPELIIALLCKLRRPAVPSYSPFAREYPLLLGVGYRSPSSATSLSHVLQCDALAINHIRSVYLPVLLDPLLLLLPLQFQLLVDLETYTIDASQPFLLAQRPLLGIALV